MRILYRQFTYGVMLGFFRPWHMEVLRDDEAFLRLIGWERFPSPSRLSRFFARVKINVAREIERLNQKMIWGWRGKGTRDITVDLDSHVITVYGNQQRASEGYNPKKPGRKSYHPLLAFIGETGDYIGGVLRPGKQHVLKGMKGFCRRVMAALPKDVRVRWVRADSGFYSFAFFNFLTSLGITFAIRAKRYPHDMLQAFFTKKWKHYSGRVSIGEFELQARGAIYRMIVVRKQIVPDAKLRDMMKKNPLLARDKCYEYHFIATNHPDMSGYEIWLLYRKRANCENFIKEAVYHFSLDSIVSHSYAGNAVYFQLVMLCYNLANIMKDMAKEHLKKRRTWRLFLKMILWVPGRPVTSSRKTRLILPAYAPGRDLFLDLRTLLDST